MKKRITPANITELAQDDVFVFGSNESGHHAGGAAALAHMKWGAYWGQGFGLSGQTFAIPTLDWSLDDLKIKTIQHYVRRFIKFARKHPKQTFYVTAIGCGIAGRTPEQIAPLFRGARKTKNIYLPQEFWDLL